MVAAGLDASRIGGVGLQIIRDWVLRASTPADRTGWSMGSHRGAPSKLNADHRRALAEVVEAPGPRRSTASRRWGARTGAVALGAVRHLADETTVGRELKALGFAKISARPRHYAQNELAVEAFKKAH